ncbi:hypothetical protein [Mycolicibacterium septicum]|uniref:hypothetical protein n=1 Tax=Mycolicibacterium septicum TaxID=98668 RepID=UPI001AF07018|nr:hypothetical protein [Mycolicibacterium septicum]QRY51830.1 hypothetical protein JVX95_31400 [Mycolicibacterium septicum]
MSVHISDDGTTGMDLRLVRRFVDATRNYPENTRVKGGVVGLVGKGLSIAYSDLHGLETI